MQVNIELRNLHGDERAKLSQSVREAQRGSGDVEIVVRARAVDVDTFGRDTVLSCTGAEVQVDERSGRRNSEARGRRPFLELHLGGGNSSPTRRPNLPGPDPVSIPAPIMPAWAGDIGDTPQRLAEIQQWRRDEAEADEGGDREEPGLTFRFGQGIHRWGR